jgi:hypothetical protein
MNEKSIPQNQSQIKFVNEKKRLKWSKSVEPQTVDLRYKSVVS